ncbi:hypothetical protein E2C01_073997 [Portunus trituberculatus]|uniref:Uncharacterized protein n=1 Tax=Portunus trituberculatus TaxID=210409 RepID=A0A5B7IF62_PORTR|nr:hypothetical protein [Portunus trituberculatus]
MQPLRTTPRAPPLECASAITPHTPAGGAAVLPEREIREERTIYLWHNISSPAVVSSTLAAAHTSRGLAMDGVANQLSSRQTPSGHAAVPNDSLSSAHISADIAGANGALGFNWCGTVTIGLADDPIGCDGCDERFPPRVHVYGTS